MKTIINFTKLTNTAKDPVCGSLYSAGHDLSADIDKSIMIPPHQTVKIPTGIAMELPEGTFGGIYPRSGIATKEGLAPANKVGVLDCDYRGGIIVALHNHSDEYRIVEPGQRIAQLIIQPFISVQYNEVSELSTTDRGAGGFGSTGK
jgi:dUTP pyrophosphatase